LLKNQLSEHSEGALKDYVELLDLETEGISSVEDFVKHLEEAAEPNGFTLDEISKAMLESLAAEAEAEDLKALASQLTLEAEGTLKAELENLDLEQEGISSPKELFEHLYEQAGPMGYHNNEVDAMLSDVLAHGDAELLKQVLTENSEGALKEYLLQLDLEAEGITNEGELLRHLEEVAQAEGFDMEGLRKAMLESLDHPLEVDRLFEELLGSTDGVVNEILEQIDLRQEGIYTVEELIESLYREMVALGISKQEIEENLLELFPGHEALIQELGKQYGKDSAGNNKIGWPLILLFVAVGAGLIWLIILWWKRRDKQKDQDA
jgi:hypothetical protein